MEKDVLDIKVNLQTHGGPMTKRMILTAADDEEVRKKLDEWLHFMRHRLACSLDGYDVLKRMRPSAEDMSIPKRTTVTKKTRTYKVR